MALSCKYGFGVQDAVYAALKDVLAADFPAARISYQTWRDGRWDVGIGGLSEYEELAFKLKLNHLCEITVTGTDDRPARSYAWAVSRRDTASIDKEALLVELCHELNAAHILPPGCRAGPEPDACGAGGATTAGPDGRTDGLPQP